MASESISIVVWPLQANANDCEITMDCTFSDSQSPWFAITVLDMHFSDLLLGVFNQLHCLTWHSLIYVCVYVCVSVRFVCMKTAAILTFDFTWKCLWRTYSQNVSRIFLFSNINCHLEELFYWNCAQSAFSMKCLQELLITVWHFVRAWNFAFHRIL